MSQLNVMDDENQRLSALYRYNVLDTDYEDRFDRITKAVETTLDVPITLISLIDTDRQWFKSKRGLATKQTARDISFCTHTVKDAKPLIVEDADQDPEFCKNPLVTGDPNIKSYLGVPLISPDGHAIGTLCAIDTVPRKYDIGSIELLERLGELVIHELELRKRAETDSLTGALNFGAFVTEAQKSISLFERQKIESALLVFDLDHFKRVNDIFGHAAGDEVLCTISAEMRKCLRPTDVFARIGGEEFAILLTGTGRNEAVGAAERLRKQIAACRFPGFLNLNVTASFGISKISQNIKRLSDWMKTADSGLYAAKDSGRNMIYDATKIH